MRQLTVVIPTYNEAENLPALAAAIWTLPIPDLKILVIDDDLAVRKAFLLALEDTSYAVDTAESGEIGLDKLKEIQFGLIFLDLKMPGMNGVETLRKIREIKPKLIVYIVTAFHQEYLAELKPLAKLGIGFELLSKPVGNDQIVEVADSVLAAITT